MMANRNTLFLLISLLMVALLFSFYYYFLLPVQDSEKSLRSAISVNEQEIQSIDARLEAMDWKQEAGDEKDLLIKLPKSKDVQMLIQLLQEAELTTQSTIQSIVFNDQNDAQQLGLPEPEEAPVEEEPIEEELQEDIPEESPNDEQTNDVEETDGENEDKPLPVTRLTTADIPENLQILTLEVSVMHEDYSQLYKFIQEIEQSDRILHIETVHFELPGENTDFAQNASAVSTIQLTAFYMAE